MRRSIPTGLLAFSALLLAAGTGSSASAVGAPSDTRTSITVDCLLGEGPSDNQVILPEETLTVTLLNCDGWNVDDEDDGTTLRDPSGTPTNTWDAVGSPVVFTVAGAADIDLDPPAGDSGDVGDIDIDVYVASPASVPSGALNLSTRLTMPVEIPDFEIDVPVGLDSVSTDMPVSIEGEGEREAPELDGMKAAAAITPAALLGGLTDCEMEDGYHPYQTVDISISTAGDFTFRVIDVTPTDEDLQWGQPYFPSQDFFLAVYTSFDPANPEANLVNCNDDRAEDRVFVVNDGETYISDDQTPEFIATLEPGDYTLLLTTYRTTSSAEWANGTFSPWSGVSGLTWDPQPMTALFELWGPTGSVTQPADEPELAATGPDLGLVVASAGLGLLAAVGGGALVLARRRTVLA